jgi:hypothetical protein
MSSIFFTNLLYVVSADMFQHLNYPSYYRVYSFTPGLSTAKLAATPIAQQQRCRLLCREQCGVKRIQLLYMELGWFLKTRILMVIQTTSEIVSQCSGLQAKGCH